MKHPPFLTILGTAPAIGVDLVTKFQTLPTEVKIDLLLRWGMYATAMVASLVAIVINIRKLREWRKRK